MKNRFIRIMPPSSFIIALLCDITSVIILFTAVIRIIHRAEFIYICLAIIGTALLFIGILTTKELLSCGVSFKEDVLIFTGLDKNNEYRYKEISEIETYKDTKASLRKTLVERYSSVIIHLKNGDVATVELGITTKRKLKRIENEINERIKKDS